MVARNKMLHRGVLGALLLAASSTSALGQGVGGIGGEPGSSVGIPSTGNTQLSGRVLCMNCSLDEMRAKQTAAGKKLYELMKKAESGAS